MFGRQSYAPFTHWIRALKSSSWKQLFQHCLPAEGRLDVRKRWHSLFCHFYSFFILYSWYETANRPALPPVYFVRVNWQPALLHFKQSMLANVIRGSSNVLLKCVPEHVDFWNSFCHQFSLKCIWEEVQLQILFSTFPTGEPSPQSLFVPSPTHFFWQHCKELRVQLVLKTWIFCGRRTNLSKQEHSPIIYEMLPIKNFITTWHRKFTWKRYCWLVVELSGRIIAN